MKIITSQFARPECTYWKEQPLDQILFFDIETTGLSADTSYLYLICCGYYQEQTCNLIQWFSEGIEDEPELLDAFFTLMKNYTMLVHYNGTTFDMNYLLKKSRQYKRNYHFDNILSLDLYKRILPFKSRFQLPNYKQKSLEEFLGIKREDTYSGGDLIPVYTKYLGRAGYEKYQSATSYHVTYQSGLPKIPEQSAKQLLAMLLLHNAEDVTGLMKISALLPLFELFEGNVPPIKSAVKQDDYEDMPGETLLLFPPQAFLITFDLPCPVTLHYKTPYYSFSLYNNLCTLKVPVLQGELKYFFTDYENYYYLSAEDKAIHKSIADFVDKSHRKKATPATAYTRKQGEFLPQTGGFLPELSTELHSFVSYFEYKEELLSNIELLQAYAVQLLTSARLQNK